MSNEENTTKTNWVLIFLVPTFVTVIWFGAWVGLDMGLYGIPLEQALGATVIIWLTLAGVVYFQTGHSIRNVGCVEQ